MNELSSAKLCAAAHLIVGDGITALAFLEHCTATAGDLVVVIGKQASALGRGVAYATGTPGTPWRYAYLLNSPAYDIDPAFADWLADRWDAVRETMAGRAPDWLAWADPLVAAGDIQGVNAPREIYGDFIEEQAKKAIATLAARGVEVRCVDASATALDVEGGQVTVHTDIGTTFVAQSLDVAPGGPSTLRIDGDDGPFAAPTVFGQEERIAEHIRAGAEILCIGGNAAMLDVLRLCQSLVPEDALKFLACAPEGELPEPLIPRLPRRPLQPNLSRDHTSADSLLAEVERTIAYARDAGHEMSEIRAGFRAYFLVNPLADHLTDKAEALRVPAHLRLWLRGGTRDTILEMRRLIAENRTEILPGIVTKIEHGPDGAVVRIRDTAGMETTRKTGFVVNCAGAGARSTYDPLTQDMLRQGLIEVCPISRGLKVGAQCRTKAPMVRHLSPATTVIGEDVTAMPLYDAHMLRTYAARASQAEPAPT